MAKSAAKPKTAPVPTAKRGFDLASIPPLSETMTVKAIDGETGESLDLEIVIAARYSQRSSVARYETVEYLRKHPPTQAEAGGNLGEHAVRVFLAHCVLSWDLLENGEPLPATPENALRLFAIRGDVLAQVRHTYDEAKLTTRAA